MNIARPQGIYQQTDTKLNQKQVISCIIVPVGGCPSQRTTSRWPSASTLRIYPLEDPTTSIPSRPHCRDRRQAMARVVLQTLARWALEVPLLLTTALVDRVDALDSARPHQNEGQLAAGGDAGFHC